MTTPHLLMANRMDRHGNVEGANYLLFPDQPTAEAFARRIASEWHGVALPDSGKFDNGVHSGEVWRYDDELTIEWGAASGLPAGDWYIIEVRPVAVHGEGMRLDFWNE